MERGPPIPPHHFDYGEYDVEQSPDTERLQLRSDPPIDGAQLSSSSLIIACNQPMAIYVAATFGLGPETLRHTLSYIVQSADRLKPLEIAIEIHTSASSQSYCLCLDSVPASAARHLAKQIFALVAATDILCLVELPLHEFISAEYIEDGQLIRGINLKGVLALEEPNLCTGLSAAAFTLGQQQQRTIAILLSYKPQGGTAQGLELDALSSLNPIVRDSPFGQDAVETSTSQGIMTQACQAMRRQPKDSLLYL
eukprot:m.73716 g.73716  ORF g.73716 m.73716 type:complete len:253 (+) comp14340_c0_seq8:47-805(+)